jgi:hypothetical protein
MCSKKIKLVTFLIKIAICLDPGMRHKEKQFSLLKRSECLAKFMGGDISHPKASENECKNAFYYEP